MAGLGQPKTGGRALGQPNRSTAEFKRRLEELQAAGLDCCPIRVLMELACGKTLTGEEIAVDPSVRAKAASDLCSFIYPKRKAVEVTGTEGTAITFAIVSEDCESSEAARALISSANELS